MLCCDLGDGIIGIVRLRLKQAFYHEFLLRRWSLTYNAPIHAPIRLLIRFVSLMRCYSGACAMGIFLLQIYLSIYALAGWPAGRNTYVAVIHGIWIVLGCVAIVGDSL